MKKDIEWLKTEIEKQGLIMGNSCIYTNDLIYLINQLDEPEVLSQEWIRENQECKDIHFYVSVIKLQNLLVPKQEITFDQVHDKLREESTLSEKSFDYYWNCINDNVEIDEPGNLLVPKQEELETKIQELIESYKQEEDAYSNPENGWISGFIEDLKNLVEKEQKYFVSSRESVGFWFLSKNNDNEVVIGTNKDYYDRKWESLKLTEEEIKDYDERYWPFAKEVEKD